MEKYCALGSLVRAGRKAAGIDQLELAKLMEVSQQTVSRWEGGSSRPRQPKLNELSSLLGLDLEDLIAVGQYGSETVHSKLRLLSLPFENLPDEAFESLCRDLMCAKYPRRRSTRNGSTGQKQFGVDVFVDGSGERIGIQCKRRKNFGPSEIRAAVEFVRPEAGITAGVIALSRTTASSAARLEMQNHPDWELWDGEDISRMIRDLPREKSVRIVDTYFDGLREEFLGIRGPSPWLTVDEVVSPISGRLAVDDNFELAGRIAELSDLRNKASQDHGVVVLVGRGGIGKTRLLREFAVTQEDRPVRFATKGPISPESYELLPTEAPIIIVDDATDFEYEILPLIQGIRSVRPDATVVLSTRPRSVTRLRSFLDPVLTDLERATVQLSDLSIHEAKQLAREALGDQASEFRSESLAKIGYDCPFLVIVGAHLVRSGDIADQELSRRSVLRERILSRFADIAIEGPNSARRGSVLSALAAIQPVPVDDPQFIDCLIAMSGNDHGAVLETIDELENLGLVLRRNQTVRVVPDLLGDALLERALVTESGLDKRFASRIADKVTGRALTHAIKNVSVIDWYRRSTGRSELADVLWSSLAIHALGLPNTDRIELVSRVTPVAAIYPDQALELVASLMACPAPNQVDPYSGIWGEPREITNSDLSRSAAPLIANVGHNRAYLDRALRMLLVIGRSDSRPENVSPDHATRLMRELGQYGPRKSLEFIAGYVETLGALLGDNSLSSDHAVLMPMLKGPLARDFTVTEWRDEELSLERHTVDLIVAGPVRSTVIQIAISCLDRDLEVANSAISVLEEVLRTVDCSESATDEFKVVVSALGSLIEDLKRPALLRYAAHNALGWHAIHGQREERVLAVGARNLLVRDDEYIIVRALRFGWDFDDGELGGGESGGAVFSKYETAAANSTKEIEQMVALHIARGEEASLLERIRRAMMLELQQEGNLPLAGRLLDPLFKAAPDLGIRVLSAPPGDGLVDQEITRSALTALLERRDTRVLPLAEKMVSRSEAQALVVASAVMDCRDPFDGVLEGLIRRLITLDSPVIHRKLLVGLRWFNLGANELIFEMLREAPIESDSGVAEASAELLAGVNQPLWTSLVPNERERFIDRFAETPDLKGYSFARLLNLQMSLEPFQVLRLLQTRVDRAGSDTDFKLFDLRQLNFSPVSELPALIDRTIEWILQGESWLRDFYGVPILQSMLSGHQEEAKYCIRKLVLSGDDGRLRLASSMLEDLPRDFVIKERQYVAALLEQTEQMPESLARFVIGGLHGSAEHGSAPRIVGHDDPEDMKLRSEATTICQILKEGSVVRQFYEEVARRASRRMEEERDSDSRFRERRLWD